MTLNVVKVPSEAGVRVPDTEFRAPTDIEYDAVIIGAGMGGLTTASQMASKGAKVVVLEKCARPSVSPAPSVHSSLYRLHPCTTTHPCTASHPITASGGPPPTPAPLTHPCTASPPTYISQP